LKQREDFEVSSSRSVFLSAVLLGGVVLFLFPSTIYRGNASFIDSPFFYVLVVLLPIWLILAVLMGLPSLLLKGRLRTVYGSILASLALTFWICGNFLFSFRGLLDGKQQVLAAPRNYQYSELAALICGILILIVMACKIPKIFSRVVIIMNLMILSLVGIVILTDQKSLYIGSNKDSIYKVSSGKNVFVFLFDTLESGLFKQVVQENPDIKERLEGFIYFSETTGVAPTTYLSMPAIHSGAAYTPGTSLGDYYNRAVSKESFVAKLASKGYDSFVVNAVGPCPKGATCFPSKELIEGFWGSVAKDACFLIDLSLYRAVPSFFKQAVYNKGEWLIVPLFFQRKRAEENNEALTQVGKKFLAGRNTPCLRFFHLFNTHPPIQLDSQCRRITNAKWNWENAKNQATCAMRHFADTLDHLKQNGVYDNALIVALADHGALFAPGDKPSLLGAAHPMLMIKPFGARKRFRISRSIVFLTDLQATICRLTKDCEPARGISVFDAPNFHSRTAVFYDYEWRHKYWKSKSVPIRAAYTIDGPVEDVFSWYKLTPPDLVKIRHLDFSLTDPEEAFGFGWRKPANQENARTRWTTGRFAQLYLGLRQNEDARLNLLVSTHAENQRQTITLYLDNQRIGKVAILPGGWKEVNFDVPGNLVSKSLSRLTFEFNEWHPAKTGTVPLSVAFHKLDVGDH